MYVGYVPAEADSKPLLCLLILRILERLFRRVAHANVCFILTISAVDTLKAASLILIIRNVFTIHNHRSGLKSLTSLKRAKERKELASLASLTSFFQKLKNSASTIKTNNMLVCQGLFLDNTAVF